MGRAGSVDLGRAGRSVVRCSVILVCCLTSIACSAADEAATTDPATTLSSTTSSTTSTSTTTTTTTPRVTVPASTLPTLDIDLCQVLYGDLGKWEVAKCSVENSGFVDPITSKTVLVRCKALADASVISRCDFFAPPSATTTTAAPPPPAAPLWGTFNELYAYYRNAGHSDAYAGCMAGFIVNYRATAGTPGAAEARAFCSAAFGS